MDDYQNLIGIISTSLKITDILREKYGESPSTFGRIGENGEALEKVLTKEDQTKWDEGLDHILVGGTSKVSVDWNSVKVEPFFTPGQPFTQISDHAGVQAGFIINPM